MNKFIFWIVVFVSLVTFVVFVSDIIVPFFVAFLLAYLIEPIIDKIYTKYNLPRSIVVYLTFFIFVSGIVILLVILIPALYHQITLLIDKIPLYKHYLQSELAPVIANKIHNIDPVSADKIKNALQSLIGGVLSSVLGAVNNVWDYTIATLHIALTLLLVPIILLYYLRDWPKIVQYIDSMLPKKNKNAINKLISNIDKLLSAYIRGQLNICLLIGLFYSIGLSLIGVEFSLLIGVISGILLIIPIIGTTISFSTAMIVAYLTFGYTEQLIYVIALYIIGYIMDGYILAPKIIGERIGIHPLWIIFSVFASGSLFGFIGIFFAIPIVGIAKVLLSEAIVIYKSSAIHRL